MLRTKIPVSQAPPFNAVLLKQECGFVCCLKPHTVLHISRWAAVPLLLLVMLTTALLHRWMAAGDGSFAGVCASSESQRVPHVSRWAAVHLLLLCFINIIGAPLENIILCTAYTPARRYCTVVQVVHDGSNVMEYRYTVVDRIQPLCRHTSCTNTPIDHKLFLTPICVEYIFTLS